MSSFFTALFEGKANLAIGSLPLHLLLAAIPHWYSIYQAESNKVRGGWTNENPRAFVARLNASAAAGKKLTTLEESILRGQAAQQNGFEWWPVWAVAVILGTVAKVDKTTMDRYTVFYTLARIVYNYVYITTSSRKGSYLRTAIFQISLIPVVAVIFKAAVALDY